MQPRSRAEGPEAEWLTALNSSMDAESPQRQITFPWYSQSTWNLMLEHESWKNNLWGTPGEFDGANDTVPPSAILAEQATQLSRMTSGLLEGRVASFPMSFVGLFSFRFKIVAPALQNFEYEVLSIEHDIRFYPVKVRAAEAAPDLVCADMDEFTALLHNILSSERVQTVVNNLRKLSMGDFASPRSSAESLKV